MKAIALDVSWSDKTTGATLAKPRDESSKQAFAQSFKESGLTDPKQPHIAAKNASKIVSPFVGEGNLEPGATSRGAVATQKAKVQGLPIAASDSTVKTPKDDEAGEAQQAALTDFKPNVVPNAANGDTEKKIRGVQKSEFVATNRSEPGALSKKQEVKSGKGSFAEGQAVKAGNSQRSSVGEETTTAQINLRSIEVQQAVPYIGLSDQKSESNVCALTSGEKSVGKGKRTGWVTGGAQRDISGAEAVKNRVATTPEGTFFTSPKDMHAKGTEESGGIKSGGETAIAVKEVAANSSSGAVKIEGEAFSRLATAIPHGVTGLVNPDNAMSHHVGIIAESKQITGQTAGLETAPSLNPHGTGNRDNYGSVAESGPALLGATPKALEVGMMSSTHGWLKIRAEIEDGVVTASLSARSMAVQEMLHHELPSLTAFLQEERIGGSTVVIKQMPSAGGGDLSHGSETQHQGRSSQQGSGGREDDTAARGNERVWSFSDRIALHDAWPGLSDTAAFVSAITGSGGWLNVRV